MANENAPEQPPASASPLAATIISPAQRQRLQKCFEQGRQLSTREKPGYDYAHTLFSECVVADPGNLLYVEALLDNLVRKHHGNKKGQLLSGFGGARAALKKAAAKGDWQEVLALGPDALRANPWDVPTLRSLAKACEAHHHHEVELRYLKNALDAHPNDVEVNRHYAESLARRGHFDQAIACWVRVEEFGKARDKDEAPKRISELTIERARGLSGLPGKVVALPKVHAPGDGERAEPEEPTAPTTSMPEEVDETTAIPQHASLAPGDANDEFRHSLEKAIAANPTDAGSYLLLADLLADAHQFDQAERLLHLGLAAAGKHLAILERLEDLQIERAAHQVAVAEKRAAAQDTEAARRLVVDLKHELNRVEMGIFRQRVDRYPHDRELPFELGLRLKRAGNWEEAAECFRQVVEQGPHQAAAALELGESLQQLKRFHDALHSYERAIDAAGEEHPIYRKKSLYRAGILATGMRQLDKAEAWLRELLALDSEYKDVPARLDKIQKIRNSS